MQQDRYSVLIEPFEEFRNYRSPLVKVSDHGKSKFIDIGVNTRCCFPKCFPYKFADRYRSNTPV